jgi:hypothetical protein
MARISTYDNASPVTLSDKVIGTSVGATPANATKNFLVSDILALFEGQINLQDVLNAGNTATQDIILTGNITVTGGNVTIGGGLVDGTSSLGTSGQALLSNGSTVYWGDVAESSIYTGSGTVPDATVATLAGSLTWLDGAMKRVVGARNIVEVTQESDMPATLVASTVYVIRGRVTFTSSRTVSNANCAVIGLDRDTDLINWTGAGALFTVTETDFTLRSLGFTSSELGASILTGTNLDALEYNDGRDKIISINDCDVRGLAGVMDLNGFKLIDIDNCVFRYVRATNFGLRFQDVDQLSIQNSQFFDWFNDSSPGTGYATVPMIELEANNISSFLSVIVDGCYIHPQDVQKGMEISTSSTTLYGVISNNVWANAGLGTLSDLFPNDYSDASMVGYNISGNRGIEDSSAYILASVARNTNTTTITTINTPVRVDLGGLATAVESERFSVSTGGLITCNQSQTFKGKISVSISHYSPTGNDDFRFLIKKGATILTSSGIVDHSANNITEVTLNFITQFTNGTTLELWVENITGTHDILVTDMQFSIHE